MKKERAYLKKEFVGRWGFEPLAAVLEREDLEDDHGWDICGSGREGREPRKGDVVIRCCMDPAVPEDSQCAKCCMYCAEKKTCEYLCPLVTDCGTEKEILQRCNVAVEN